MEITTTALMCRKHNDWLGRCSECLKEARAENEALRAEVARLRDAWSRLRIVCDYDCDTPMSLGPMREALALDPTGSAEWLASVRRAERERCAEVVRGFRENTDWRKGRLLLNGRHDRDDAIVDAIRALPDEDKT